MEIATLARIGKELPAIESLIDLSVVHSPFDQGVQRRPRCAGVGVVDDADDIALVIEVSGYTA